MQDEHQRLLVLVLTLILTIIVGRVLVVQEEKPPLSTAESPLFGEYHQNTAKIGGDLYLRGYESINNKESQVLGMKSPECYKDKIKEYDWNHDVAKAVMREESRFDPEGINWNDYHPVGNCRGSFGLFQLACFRGEKDDLLDPETNIEKAYELWKEKGWKPWGVCQPPNQKVVCWY